MSTERLEARGGRKGGGGTRTGELVIVVLDGPLLDVFHETGVQRFHAAMVEKIALQESPAPTGEALVVGGIRTGCQIPVRFEGDQRAAFERIAAAVTAIR